MKATTQIVRINGVRTKLTTRGGKVSTKAAAPLEWELQAAQVRALRALPQYAAEAFKAGPGKFTIAGDQNAAKRGPRARSEALAAGLVAGEHDLRIYMHGGRLGLIENKVGRSPLNEAQKVRHPLLAALGFEQQAVVRAESEKEAAEQAVQLVLGWLAENDNKPYLEEAAA